MQHDLAGQAEAPPKRAGLTILGVIAIGLGALGVLGGCNAMAAPWLQPAALQQQEGLLRQLGGPQAEQQLALQRAMMEAIEPYLVYQAIAGGFNFLASALLVVGGVLLLMKRPVALPAYTAGVTISALADIGTLATSVLVLRAQMGAMASATDLLGQGGQPVPPEVDRMMGAVMGLGVWVGTCFAAGWLLIKLVYYTVGIIYTRKRESKLALGVPVD